MRFKHKIAFIIVYFGEFPWFFRYFLHSGIRNPSIDFIILTDNTPVSTPSGNIKFIHYSIDQFNRDASRVLNMDIHIEKGYKLCDFKPAYGYIFSSLIENYDFWGYCDIDLIFGNIRNFMSSRILNQYDVISARHDYLTGCFALYRNQDYYNTLFMHSKDYTTVFTNQKSFFFDETNYAFEEFAEGVHYSLIKTEIESMTHVVKRLHEEKKLKALFEFQIVEGFAGNMLWNRGILTYRKEFEVMLYHMVRFKQKYSEPLENEKVIPDKFRIGKKKIYYR
ncbi:hypothetical protein SAMN05216331_11472 [Porphyromonadaceae bacterium KH3R12]|uniref:DUF6625 family protein n=1 Tax=Proteiniphilum saccharofermentans TaxID=1642647 RepID=UPI00089CCB78|nr:DUF6625 family protein [Proteiniphilum saccharofermentans]SEA01279.1 hypothetical protein SAMN05216331_11472 [Porphyromonadaceae bacterium KH3R12]